MLGQANRTEAKDLRVKINALHKKKDAYKNQMDEVENKINRVRTKIEGLNDKIFKTSIKTTQLGRDCEKNEYWYFKEEPSKMFVKRPEGEWFYYENETEINALFVSLNPKGIREKKLIENSKKILDKLKVKRARKEGEEEDKEQMEIEVAKGQDKLIFKDGDRQDISMQNVWFGLKLPTKRVF
jgi:Williams-Beuren syndrome DDT (WSD), D-TOX E motif